MIVTYVAIFCIIALLIILFVGQKAFKQYIQNAIVAFRLPGPRAYPIIGNSIMMFRNPVEYAHVAIKEYGTIQRFWGSIYPFILILDPKHIEKVFLSSKHLEKNIFYRAMEGLLGKGLVLIEASKWEKRRKLIQPRFRTSVLATYIPLMTTGASSFLKAIKETIQSGNTNEFNITKLVNASISKITTGIVLGISTDELSSTAYGSSSLGTLSLTFFKSMVFPWASTDFFKSLSATGRNASKDMDETQKWMAKLVADRKDKLKTSSFENNCILNHLLLHNFSDEECVDELHSFMLVGQDTVSAAVALSIHLLAKHQDVQDKVYAEIESILGKEPKPITKEDIYDLQYTEQCVKETLRLYPLVNLFGRTLSQEIDLDGTKLPAGCQIIVAPYITQRMPEYFPDPEVFDPDRFNLKNSLNRPTCAYMPFSQGSRNCIGNNLALMETKVMVVSTLQKYHVSLPVGKEELRIKLRVSARVTGGVWIKFTERKTMGK